jgi:hypothetical protein
MKTKGICLIKLSGSILRLNILFWISYNTFYGWNKRPINSTEEMLDTIASLIAWIGIILYFTPLLEYYTENFKKKNTK